jgi:hypothetical protein
MLYNTDTKEILVSSTSSSTNWNKTFIIDHPDDDSKYLVHACLEGPEVGVYYRGKGEITNNEFVEISLPDYVTNLATDFTVQISPIHNSKKNSTRKDF